MPYEVDAVRHGGRRGSCRRADAGERGTNEEDGG